MQKISFAQVWEEEQGELARIAGLVPEGGIILEIGTAQGGTSAIFYNATKHKNVNIYSVDIAPSCSAYRNLQRTGVRIIRSASAHLATIWMQKVRMPIDLLFIDGNHNFQSLFMDFTLWAQQLRPGGIVIFHDYDPAERGGLAHFGVRVCVDTILRMKLLDHPQHIYKLLWGHIANPAQIELSVTHCLKTLEMIVADVIQTRKSIFGQSIESGFRILRDRTLSFDSVQACYSIDYALKKDYGFFEKRSDSPHEFRRWAETLSMLEHGFGLLPFEDRAKTIPATTDVKQLSRFIAAEQTRLTILACILRGLVPWTL
ncbi:MAG: class I SAM-dependent methyltransferase [Chloroflexota bacterium]